MVLPWNHPSDQSTWIIYIVSISFMLSFTCLFRIPKEPNFARGKNIPPGVVVEPTKEEQKKAAEENPSILRKYVCTCDVTILYLTLESLVVYNPSDIGIHAFWRRGTSDESCNCFCLWSSNGTATTPLKIAR